MGWLKRLLRLDIVSKNLRLMLSEKDGGMLGLLHGESIGGNAGHYKGYPCAGVNFNFDSKNGRIVYFGNFQSVPEEIIDNYPRGDFRIVCALGHPMEKELWHNLYVKIIKVTLPKGKFSKQAMKNIEASALAYNDKFKHINI